MFCLVKQNQAGFPVHKITFNYSISLPGILNIVILGCINLKVKNQQMQLEKPLKTEK